MQIHMICLLTSSPSASARLSYVSLAIPSTITTQCSGISTRDESPSNLTLVSRSTPSSVVIWPFNSVVCLILAVLSSTVAAASVEE